MSLPHPETVHHYISETIASVFASMMQLETAVKSKSDFNPPDPEITANVSFTGEINGVVCLTFQEDYAKILTSRMIGLEIDEIAGHEEINDAVGEIANMVAGNFKSKLSSASTPAILSIPSICRGKNIKIESIHDAIKFEFAFAQGDHVFLVDIFLQESSHSKQAFST
ncbi:chemotaxis protein CheX [Kamptonema cortianum]|nr:chemotaxis protein CheX [Oscillatoria laete-virens]MDK3161839.1 chemotaxis protein CheX [Kamptonema cortianum]MDL5054409.1 chemotaxis protein CheX [Oscillatoria laete-virens NRMC-F 0139]